MFPSSQSDIHKFCCNRSTCSKRQENSSLQTSSIEEIDQKPDFSWNKFNQETQMSPSVTTTSSEKNSIPTQTSTEKSSQAYFDRNNQNLSFCYNKICPSNSTHTHQQPIKSQLHNVMIKCPQKQNRPQCCLKCKRLEQPSCNTSTILAGTNKSECVCKNLDLTSSSSSSLTSEHFPVKLTLRNEYNERKMPVAKRKYGSKSNKPILAAPPPSKIENRKLYERKNYKAFNYQKSDQYYSCSSDDSDDNSSIAKSFSNTKRSNPDKNHVILELLHEVVHLINKDNPIREEALRITQVVPSSQEIKSSKVTAPTSKVKVEPKQSELTPPPIDQLPLLKWPLPCLCYAYDMASLQDPTHFNLPLLRPFNLASSTKEDVQIPQPFVYEESYSFKGCSSGNKSLDKTPDNMLCICSNICPKHGSLKKVPEQPTFPCSCAKENKPADKIKTEDIDEKLYPSYIDKECLGSYNAIKPCHDSLMAYDDEESNQRKDDIPVDEELQTIFIKHSVFELYEPCQDCLMEYDDEEPSRTNIKTVKDEQSKLEDNDEEILYDPYKPCQDCLWEYDDEEPSRTDIHNIKDEGIKLEVDEELYPHYVDKTSLSSFNPNEPSPDSLVEYDDEEPKKSHKSKDLDEELQLENVEQIAYNPNEPCLDSLREYDDEEPSWPEIPKNLIPKEERPPNETSENQAEVSFNQEPDNNNPERSKENHETLQVLEETKKSPYIVETTASTGRNIYNFLPEIDRPSPGDPKQIIRYDTEEEYDSNYLEDESDFLEDEYELAKEIRAERRKKKNRDSDKIPGESMALATIKQMEEGEGSPEEMKFFIDSLIMDLDAMEYARRKTQFEKNICKSKSCARESFPVTITEVTELGANSLYVKWKIHDCYGIAGYEIYTDGYLTNRYYNNKHEAAVITQVDITLPHKIALVAQASNDDESIAFMCNTNKNKTKSLPWKTDVVKEPKSLSALWTPSIYLYDPITCKAALIMRDNF